MAGKGSWNQYPEHRKNMKMARDEIKLHRFDEVLSTRPPLVGDKMLADRSAAVFLQVMGKRLRAIYPVSAEADQPAALRSLIEELAAKGM
jgi:hypothetical protein